MSTNSGTGTTRVLEFNDSSWIQLGADIDGEKAGDQSGHSVSLSSDGTTLAIGSYENDDNGVNSGHVRVYNYNGTDWSKLGSDIEGEAAGDQFGRSLFLSSDGTTLAVGAILNDGSAGNSGKLRVYNFQVYDISRYLVTNFGSSMLFLYNMALNHIENDIISNLKLFLRKPYSSNVT